MHRNNPAQDCFWSATLQKTVEHKYSQAHFIF